VNAVLSGTTTAVHFNSPASPGLLRLGALTSTLDAIKGPVVFDGGTGGSSISVSDAADTTGRIVHLTQTTLGAFPGDTLFPAGGSLTFSHIVAGFNPALTLNLGSGADTIYAQPNPTGTQTITGGSPTAAPGDTLNLALAGAQNFALHGTAASGNVTSTNLKTLTYSGFESGPTVDSVAPLVVNADINLNGIPVGAAPVGGPANAPLPGNRQSIDVSFSEDVAILSGPGAIQLQNLTTGQTVPAGSIALTYDSTARIAHFTFPGYPKGVLPDGNYHGVILGGAIGDGFGNALSGDVPFDFFVLAGDANHDRAVNFSDLVVVAQHYGSSGRLFSEGDFDYDSLVGFSDLVTVAQKYGTTLAPPAPAATPEFVAGLRSTPVATKGDSKKQAKPIFSVTRIVKPAPVKRTTLPRRG